MRTTRQTRIVALTPSPAFGEDVVQDEIEFGGPCGDRTDELRIKSLVVKQGKHFEFGDAAADVAKYLRQAPRA